MSAIEFARTKMSAFYKKISPRIQNPIGRHYFTEIFDVFLQHPATHGKMLVDLVERLPHFFSPQIVAETKEHVRVVTDYLKNMKSVPTHSPFGPNENEAAHVLSQYVQEYPNMSETVRNMVRTIHSLHGQPTQLIETMVYTEHGWAPFRQVNPVIPPVVAVPNLTPMQAHAPSPVQPPQSHDAPHPHLGFAENHALHILSQYVRENPSMFDTVLNMIRTGHTHQSQSMQPDETVKTTNCDWTPLSQNHPVDMTAPVPVGPKFESAPVADPVSPTNQDKVENPPMRYGDYIVRDGSDEIHVPDTEDQITVLSSDATVIVNFLNDCLARVNADEFVRNTSGIATDLWFMITGVCQNGLTGAWAKRIAESTTYIYNTFGSMVVNKEPAEFDAVIAVLKRNFEPQAPVAEKQSGASETVGTGQVDQIEKILAFLNKCLASGVVESGHNKVNLIVLRHSVFQCKQTGIEKQDAEVFLKVLGSYKGADDKFIVADFDDEYKEVLAILSKIAA